MTGRATRARGRGPSLMPRTRRGRADDVPGPSRSALSWPGLFGAPTAVSRARLGLILPGLASPTAGPSSDAAPADVAIAVGRLPSDPAARAAARIRFSFPDPSETPSGGARGAASLEQRRHTCSYFQPKSPDVTKALRNGTRPPSPGRPAAQTMTELRAPRRFRDFRKRPPHPVTHSSTFSYAARPMRKRDRMSCSGEVTLCSNTRAVTLVDPAVQCSNPVRVTQCGSQAERLGSNTRRLTRPPLPR